MGNGKSVAAPKPDALACELNMTPEKWERVKAVFHSALDLPESERASFIASECGDDAAMLVEVNSLFESHVESEELFESPAFESISSLVEQKALPSRVGQSIGNYKIESEIGRGGMGAVYLASRADAEFDKKVAIKLIKRGFDTEEVIKRFRHERQILAALEHPNITRLLDGGSTEDGLPFLVMDYVDGRPLHRFADENGLSINKRLSMFLKICSAVSYAHQNLVIHRDLKPSNILVTADGEPKLLDFGIAKLTGPSGNGNTFNNTQTKFQAMTPEYASPEQISGKGVTTASDIYSLGILLYELLTGHRPFRFETKNVAEISAIITDSTPTKPSTVCRQLGVNTTIDNAPAVIRTLKGDLDNIVMMAIRKETERRYSSVEQFAGDIRRYLGGHPVIAREDTFIYRATKFASRNKVGVASVLGIGASLVGGLFAVSRQARIASTQRDRARREARKAKQVNEFLQKMLASADPYEQGKDVKIIEVLGKATMDIEMDFVDQPEITADLHTTIGTTYLHLGQFGPAEEHLKKALETRLEIFPRMSFEVAESLSNYGRLLQLKGDFNPAEPYFYEAAKTLRTLGRNKELAETLHDLGYLLVLNGKNDLSVDAYREALEIRKYLFGESHPDTAKTLGGLAQAYHVLGDRLKTISLHRQALAILQRHYPESHPDVIMAMSRVASALMWADTNESERLFEKVLVLKRKHLGNNHPEVAWTLYELTFLNVQRGNYERAETIAREVLAMRSNGLNPEHASISSVLISLGRSLLAQGRPDEARLAIEECLILRTKTHNENHWALATTNSVYGECLFMLGETERGKRLLYDSHERLLKEFGPDHDLTQSCLERIERLFGED